MSKILYVGNYLRSRHNNISSIHTLGSLLESEGYTLYYSSDKINKIHRMLDMVSSVLKYRNNVDFIIIDTYSTLNFYFALIVSQLCRILKIRYITNLNGGNLPMRLEKNPYLSGLIFNNAYCNVAPSQYLKDAFTTSGYKKLRYIPNTLNIDEYKIEEKIYDSPRMLWVRSFSKIYNPQMAIKVLKLLKDIYPDATLCMVGPDSDGSLKDTKKFAKKLGLKVKFTGKLSKPQWRELSKDYNIFMNTTNFDNTPVSVIEAMALGLPIVTTNVGGMPYLIEDEIHGLLVAPNQPKEMVNAILRIFKNPELRNCVINNARLRAEQFNWEEVKDQWHGILTSGNIVSKY